MNITKAKTFQNIVYTSCGKGATVVFQTVTSSFLARSLSASDFGVVGFAMIVTGFLARFSDLGIGSAIVRRPQVDQEGLNVAFTLKLVLSVSALIFAFFLAPLVGRFFQHPDIIAVVRVLALNFVITNVGFVHQIGLMRELNYKALLFPGFINASIRCLVAIILVRAGAAFWAIVFADLGANLASGIALRTMRRVKLRLRWNWSKMSEYLSFGIPLFANGLVVFLVFNLANVLVGSIIGTVELGYYALAFSWGTLGCGLLAETVNTVLFPTLSVIQSDRNAMRRWYLKTVDLVALLITTINMTLLANADSFLHVFLGKGTDKWGPATTSLKILCLYGIVRGIVEPIGNCILARGATKVLFHASLLAGACQILLLILVLPTKRIDLVAIAVLAAYSIQATIYVPFLRREFDIRARDLFLLLWPITPCVLLGWGLSVLAPAPDGTTLLQMGCRGLFTMVAIALVHGACSRFRCFLEIGNLIAVAVAGLRARG